jgi:hypothetical protein
MQISSIIFNHITLIHRGMASPQSEQKAQSELNPSTTLAEM